MLLVTDWFDLDPLGRGVLCFLYLGLLQKIIDPRRTELFGIVFRKLKMQI